MTFAALDHIVALMTAQKIIASTAVNFIATAPAKDHVVAIKPRQGIIAALS